MQAPSHLQPSTAIAPSANEHIREFLDYYCRIDGSPGYAVLIKGPWGSGKSKLIADFLDELTVKGVDHLYVSLYGIRSVNEIENEFFRQLHPLLASKGAKLAGKLLKGILRASIKVDLDGDGNSDGNITISPPSEGFLQTIQSPEGRVLVFDDLERCSIPITDLLGYINFFVEHSGLKVILIANEEEILEKGRKTEIADLGRQKETTITQYERVKEKMIGKSLEVTPEIQPALDFFTELIQNPAVKSLVVANRSLITGVYLDSRHKNLRTLKHTLLEFERLYGALTDSVRDAASDAFVSQLISLFLIYSLEILNGVVDASQIEQLGGGLSGYLGSSSESHSSVNRDPIRDIRTRYVNYDLDDTIFSSSIWSEWFRKGFIRSEIISEAVLSSKYYRSESQPDWIQLWHFEDLSDEDFSNFLLEVINSWEKRLYTEIGEIKHVTGILLLLSKFGLYQAEQENILDSAKEYVDYLKNTQNLLKPSELNEPFPDTMSWHGLAFRSREEPFFQNLVSYISEKEEEALIESYPTEARRLLTEMTEDTIRFARLIVLTNHQENRFYDTPILSYVDPGEFTSRLIQLTQEKRRLVGRALRERYKIREFIQKLLPEMEFLSQVADLLEQESARNSGSLSGYNAQSFRQNCILPELEKLRKLSENSLDEQELRIQE